MSASLSPLARFESAGRGLRGFDFVQMRGREIARNEVYTHEIRSGAPLS